MPWHLDQYGKVKQGVSIFKTYIGNIDRASILPIYRTFSSSWSSLTGNEIPAPKTLAKIYNEPFLTLNTNNPSINKTRFIYLFITKKDLFSVIPPGFITADEFIKSQTQRKHIYNPGYLDYLEILKPIPKDWKTKKKQNNAFDEQDALKVMAFLLIYISSFFVC